MTPVERIKEGLRTYITNLSQLAGHDLSDVCQALEEVRVEFLPEKETAKDRRYSTSQAHKIWKSQHGVCASCRQTLIDPVFNNQVARDEQCEIDHYQPWSKGGKTELSNARAVHFKCHSDKGSLEPIAYSKRSGRTILEEISGTPIVGAAQEIK